jgi:hypothetical protein
MGRKVLEWLGQEDGAEDFFLEKTARSVFMEPPRDLMVPADRRPSGPIAPLAKGTLLGQPYREWPGLNPNRAVGNSQRDAWDRYLNHRSRFVSPEDRAAFSKVVGDMAAELGVDQSPPPTAAQLWHEGPNSPGGYSRELDAGIKAQISKNLISEIGLRREFDPRFREYAEKQPWLHAANVERFSGAQGALDAGMDLMNQFKRRTDARVAQREAAAKFQQDVTAAREQYADNRLWGHRKYTPEEMAMAARDPAIHRRMAEERKTGRGSAAYKRWHDSAPWRPKQRKPRAGQRKGKATRAEKKNKPAWRGKSAALLPQSLLKVAKADFDPDAILGPPPRRPPDQPARGTEIAQRMVIPAVAAGAGFALGRFGARNIGRIKPLKKWSRDADFMKKYVLPSATAAAVGLAAWHSGNTSDTARKQKRKRKRLQVAWDEHHDYYRRLRKLTREHRRKEQGE